MSRTAPEVLEYLPSDLVRVLASLDGAAPAIAEMAINLLPFGYRAALEPLQLAVGYDVDGRRQVTLLPLAYDVIAEAAASLSGEAERVKAAELRAADAVACLGLRLDVD